MLFMEVVIFEFTKPNQKLMLKIYMSSMRSYTGSSLKSGELAYRIN